MVVIMVENCVCDSTKPFEACCQPALDGVAYARTPEQLMRSRYAAYALGGYGQYLLDSWLPATATGLTSGELSLRNHQWLSLKILNRSQSGDNATVEFNARYREQNGRECCLHEQSVFKRVKGRWLYVGRELS
jgi:SEC-C motif-containing protein